MTDKHIGLTKKSRVMVFSSVITAILLVVALACTMFADAWFKNFLKFENPAKLSNFVVGVRYSKDNGSTWTTLSDGAPIELSSLEEANKVKIQISYRGFSAAYLRTSLTGNFYNANTETYLPQPESFWRLVPEDSTKWVEIDENWYYTSLLKNMDNETLLSVLSVSIDTSQLGIVSDHQEYAGKIYIVVDAVQPDRCEAFWGVSPSEFES